MDTPANAPAAHLQTPSAWEILGEETKRIGRGDEDEVNLEDENQDKEAGS